LFDNDGGDYAGKSSMKRSRDDADLQKRVLEELKFEPSANATHIGVAVEDAIVSLSGHVASYVEKFEVERAVRRVKGVAGIAEQIEVRYPNDKAPPIEPSDIQRKIEDALRRRAEVQAKAIRVKVHDRTKVCLEGSVDSWDERQAAESAAWSAAGVQLVDNRLSIVR
jgi:osmotically-inducible protein OsmY